jgi:glucan phosphoethanolaminetransferase (alkaline phosphatase superfamily)
VTSIGNKIQRQFTKEMKKIARQESRRKKRFYSFLERDIISGYYSIKKRETNKFVLFFIKIMQYIMSAFILVFGMLLAFAIINLESSGAFFLLTLISLTLLLFGFIHPNIIWDAHRRIPRKRVLKLFGITTITCLFVGIVLEVIT